MAARGAGAERRARALRRWARNALGAGTAAAAATLALRATPALREAEERAYDARVSATARPGSARPDIAILAIDDRSLAELEPVLGRWPFSRAAHADVVSFL